jgi:secretion/DNA translocation related TadE-like protein
MVAIVAALISTTIGVSGAAALLVERHRVAVAADAAAIAAADVASGLVAGVPCDVAGGLAAANSTRLDECVTEGSTVTVRLLSTGSPVPIGVTATAGQPPYADSGRTVDPKK